MTTRSRPLSPHLQVYRLPLTALMSVTHRATGTVMGFGCLLLAYWLGAAAYGREAYATAQWLIGSWIGILALLGFSFSLFFHLCNGVRHLLWDIGWGFEKAQYTASGYVTILVALALTGVTWIAGFIVYVR